MILLLPIVSLCFGTRSLALFFSFVELSLFSWYFFLSARIWIQTCQRRKYLCVMFKIYRCEHVFLSCSYGVVIVVVFVCYYFCALNFWRRWNNSAMTKNMHALNTRTHARTKETIAYTNILLFFLFCWNEIGLGGWIFVWKSTNSLKQNENGLPCWTNAIFDGVFHIRKYRAFSAEGPICEGESG